MQQKTKCFYDFGTFRLDPVEHVLLSANSRVLLTPKAFETLLALVEGAGHILEKDALLKRVWPDTYVEEGTLARNISTLGRLSGMTLKVRPTSRPFPAVATVLWLPSDESWTKGLARWTLWMPSRAQQPKPIRGLSGRNAGCLLPPYSLFYSQVPTFSGTTRPIFARFPQIASHLLSCHLRTSAGHRPNSFLRMDSAKN